jgi:hypothetical protein
MHYRRGARQAERRIADQTPLISLGHALMANSWWRGQEKRMSIRKKYIPSALQTL